MDSQPEPRGGKKRIAISGASGFIGRALRASLMADGFDVWPLVRRPGVPGEIGWDPRAGRIDAAALEGLEAVVHLAGEPIAGIWTAGKRRRIVESRLQGTRILAQAIARLERPPRVLVSASAIGYYGDRGDEWLDEESAPGTDFLAELCRAWEGAAESAAAAGVRVVTPRFGMVLGSGGGALKPLLAIFRLGLGARLGSGRHWVSWIGLPDAIRALHFLIEHPNLRGAVNLVSPEPVRNRDFTRALAGALGRRAPWAIPAPLLSVFSLGMADAVLLASQRVRPGVLLEHGFDYEAPELEPFLVEELGPVRAR